VIVGDPGWTTGDALKIDLPKADEALPRRIDVKA